MYYAKLVHPDWGMDGDKESAKLLDLDIIYEVDDVEIGSWISYVSFKNVKGEFNTVQFDFYDEDMNEINIIDTEFNPYT